MDCLTRSTSPKIHLNAILHPIQNPGFPPRHARKSMFAGSANRTKMFHVNKCFSTMRGKTWAGQDRSRRAMRLEVSQRAPPIV